MNNLCFVSVNLRCVTLFCLTEHWDWTDEAQRFTDLLTVLRHQFSCRISTPKQIVLSKKMHN